MSMRSFVSRFVPGLAIASVIVLASFAVHAGKLQKAKDQVRGSSSGSGKSSKSSKSSRCGSSSSSSSSDSSQPPYDANQACPPDNPFCEDPVGDDDFEWMYMALFWHGPHVLIEGDDDYDCFGYFLRAPYWDGGEGYMAMASRGPGPQIEVETTQDGDYLIGPSTVTRTVPARSRSAALRLTAEYGHDFENIHKPSGYALLSTRWRLGLESGWTYFREQSENQAIADQLYIGDINLIHRFAQNENIQMRSGAGLRLMPGENRVDLGFNFTYGMDIYPTNPLVFSASVDIGNLGMAFLLHGRAHLGVVFWGLEIFAGWDGWLIGEVAIGGLSGGLRVWL